MVMNEFALSVRDIGLQRLVEHRQAQATLTRRLTVFSEKLVRIAQLVQQLPAGESRSIERRINPIIAVVKQQFNLRSKLNRIDKQLDAIIADLESRVGQ